MCIVIFFINTYQKEKKRVNHPPIFLVNQKLTATTIKTQQFPISRTICDTQHNVQGQNFFNVVTISVSPVLGQFSCAGFEFWGPDLVW